MSRISLRSYGTSENLTSNFLKSRFSRWVGSSMVEQWPFKPVVAGSSPARLICYIINNVSVAGREVYPASDKGAEREVPPDSYVVFEKWEKKKTALS